MRLHPSQSWYLHIYHLQICHLCIRDVGDENTSKTNEYIHLTLMGHCLVNLLSLSSLGSLFVFLLRLLPSYIIFNSTPVLPCLGTQSMLVLNTSLYSTYALFKLLIPVLNALYSQRKAANSTFATVYFEILVLLLKRPLFGTDFMCLYTCISSSSSRRAAQPLCTKKRTQR